ncbi:MAG: DUF4136 domain-containing protein [Pseudomonadota bacterium]
MFDLRCIKFALLATGFGLVLSGCTSTLSSDVVTFHDGALHEGETIRVVAIDPAKVPSLEFRSYANLVNEELRKIGYTPVTDENSIAQLLAEVDYSVESGESLVNVNDPTRYARYHFSLGRFYDPFYLGVYDPWGSDIVSTTPTFVRNLQLNIVTNDETKTHIFEGRVQSNGIHNQLPEIMPYLVTAMFSNFPGESGVTKVVTVETAP